MTWRDKAKTAVEKNRGGGSPTKLTKPPFVSSVSSHPATFPPNTPADYTIADLTEMDRKLRELAVMEGWDEQELSNTLDQRSRMAPANVFKALGTIRAAHDACLKVWPEVPPTRSRIVLCELEVR